MDLEPIIEYITANATLSQVIAVLEREGFQCYETETFYDLIYALAEHCLTEDIDVSTLF